MGFSDEDRILIDNLYVFIIIIIILKSYLAKNLLKNFRIMVGDCGTEQTSVKAEELAHYS